MELQEKTIEFDFGLKACCHKTQYITFGVIGGCVLVSLVLWKFVVLEPFKLLTVFLHEFSHASACWMTGGKVKGIEVNKNHGGTTHTVGGNAWLILPAGYIGSCFYGMVFILMAYLHAYTLLASSGLLCLLLIVVLIFFAKNMLLRILCILFFVITIGLTAVCCYFKYELNYWPLKILMIYIGVLNEMYSVVDIVEDLITRTVPESDAYKYATLTNCNSKFCGVLWFLINLGFVCVTFYLIAAIRVKPFYYD